MVIKIVLMGHKEGEAVEKQKKRYIFLGWAEKKGRKAAAVWTAAVFCLLFLVSCGREPAEKEQGETGFVAAQKGIFDSADTAVVAGIDTGEKTITLKNMEVKRQYTLSYDGRTFFYDKYGKVISAAQLPEGEIVDVTFFKERKRLNTLQISKEAWSHRYMDEYRLDEAKAQAQVKSMVYACPEEVVVIADGGQGSLIDISPVDLLTFRGIGSDIYSIVVEKGHGYVRLKNEEYFHGGWIEIGNKIIKRVAENMMFTVPEGRHQVIISNKGTSGVREIEVRKNVELELDVGDLKGEEPKYGRVRFAVTPEEAVLYLDGVKTDYSAPVELACGIHQMIVMADGYETISQYLKVGQGLADIKVEMKERESVSGNDVSGGDALSDSELLKKVNELLEKRGYSGITADDLVGNAANQSQNTAENNGADATGNNAADAAGVTQPDAAGGNGQTSADAPAANAVSYYVTIDAPTGVELYLDGNYVGITPCSFKKEPGSHTLTLRKNGYVSKSYTIQTDGEQKNMTYSFLDLVKIE